MLSIIICEFGTEKFENKKHNEENIENRIIEKVDTNITEKTMKEPNLISLGMFKLTAYCPCTLCCGKWADNRRNDIVYGAIGEELKENHSIAVDPNIIPYKTEVVINGHTYKAQDCGGGIKGNEIDIYFENHNEALEFGVQYAEVFMK